MSTVEAPDVRVPNVPNLRFFVGALRPAYWTAHPTPVVAVRIPAIQVTAPVAHEEDL